MKIALLSCLAFWLCFAQSPRQILPPEQVKAVLQSISDTAIVLGNGPRAIHSFIDPKCEMSRRYMGFIMKKRAMLQRYTYYFYLLELERLDSRGYIGYIFESPDPAKLLTSIMLDDLKPGEAQEYLPDDATEERMERIAKAAKAIGVYKRPYIIYNGKAK
jgi:hypothetical protein